MNTYTWETDTEKGTIYSTIIPKGQLNQPEEVALVIFHSLLRHLLAQAQVSLH